MAGTLGLSLVPLIKAAGFLAHFRNLFSGSLRNYTGRPSSLPLRQERLAGCGPVFACVK